MATGPVLLCYDGSESSRRAITAAGELLAPRAAVVAHAWEPAGPPRRALEVYLDVIGTPPDEFNRVAAETAAETAKEGAAVASEAGFDATPLAVSAPDGVPAGLLAAAEEQDVSAIAVGSQGRSAMGRLVLGSTSTALLQLSKRPVLVVRG